MTMQSVYPHIEQRPDGKMWLIGTQIKVIEVALDRLAHHWDADEIQRQHPHLTLGQIYSCLAYYYDHQESMDRIVEDQLIAIARFRREACGPTNQDVSQCSEKKTCRTCLADWAETNGEKWGEQLDSENVDGFTGRRF